MLHSLPCMCLQNGVSMYLICMDENIGQETAWLSFVRSLSQQSTTLGKLETRIDHLSCRTLANTISHFYAIASVDFCMSSSDEFYFQPTHFTGTFGVVL